MVRRRADSLQLAVLGLLSEGPLHGYEVRRRLDVQLGIFRALSYGTLYPCLRTLQAEGWVRELSAAADPDRATRRRERVVYEITESGRERLRELLKQAGPAAWDDDAFSVHFALFTRTDPRTRLRILEGRKARLQERVEELTRSIERAREQLDTYTYEYQRHGLETARREVDWIEGLINAEGRRGQQ
ncbi:DNA-binding PadR family transcriptional regulator [Kineococcus xinjiangensis]|uniref:DNA-binding PadR family transcriptional regulator n=1 Tax=Kineococcus xinjiangensis TaxID=512762 RepID=A0A2S6IJ23_9ACTN|nr:PadR family transcriptional regulator [Kineococcus xinjiangensis]PPK94191.1 DNA-binding PadR family transcriptional regulator [Kineococcus xinjiangensis]